VKSLMGARRKPQHDDSANFTGCSGGAHSVKSQAVIPQPAATDMLMPPHPPRREPRLYLPIGVLIGFALAMLIDAILHAALYQPPWRTEMAPMHQMTRQAFQRPLTFPPDLFHGDLSSSQPQRNDAP
jgi:hypothetical protein